MQTKVHKIDSSRIEIRTVHEIATAGETETRAVGKNSKWCGFELEAYFHVPRRLAYGNGDEPDGAQTLAQSVVFPKIQRKNYYEIFAMNLAAILDPANELSPLTRLEHMAQKVVLQAEPVFYELQMLLCVTKNASNNARRAQIQRLRARSAGEQAAGQPHKRIHEQNHYARQIREALYCEVESEFTQISNSYLQIQNRLEQLGERYLHEVLNHLNEAYRWTLEDLNHQILDWMLRSLRLSEHYHFSNEFQQFIQAELELQWRYQRQHGFATLSDDEYNNEGYLFHQRELKAWRYGGLSMSSNSARSQSVMAHFWLSMASAVAMIFALGVTLITMYYYGQWSMPFVIFAVLGYMFKDRIKEVLRKLFADKFGNYQLLHLYDPRSKEQCGSIREHLDVCDQLPAEISTLRQLHKNPLSQIYNREVVIVYRERLSINSTKLFRTHKRLQRGCQILEFNLLPYLQNIKDSEAKQLWHPPSPEEFSQNKEESASTSIFLKAYRKLRIQRSYHLTLIIQARSFNGRVNCERYRIVLRGSKIAWIKQVV